MGHIGHLPVAVHRALQEKALRDERDRAQNSLRHSEALYRALAVNLSYGICRCDLDGKFLEVNEAMVKMLGYASKEELLAVNLASGLIQDPGKRAQLLGQPDQQGSVDPIEIEWKRKDHTAPVGGSSASTGGSRPTDRTGQLPPSRGSAGYGDQAFSTHRARVCPVVV